MKTLQIEKTPLALPCPAWHTIDSNDQEAMSRFWRMLWEATPRGILDMLAEHERFIDSGLHADEFTWLPERGRYGWVRVDGATRNLPTQQAILMRERADSVTYWIKSEIIRRYDRGVAAREEAAAKAASTRRMNAWATQQRRAA